VPGRRNAAATAIWHAGAHRTDHRGEKNLALPEADIAVHEAGEIAGIRCHRSIGRQVLVDFADDCGEIDPVCGRLPFLGEQFAVDGVQTFDPAAALAGIGWRAVLQQRLDHLVGAARHAKVGAPDAADLIGIRPDVYQR